jgi:hypothetical protein
MRTARQPTARTFAAAIAACSLSLAAAAPSLARPAGHGPARPCIGCAAAPSAVHGTDRRRSSGLLTGSLAGTSEAHPGLAPASRVAIRTPDDGGATTLALLLTAGGALVAGGAAGFAGGRRLALRP